jgi:hypothetical protein
MLKILYMRGVSGLENAALLLFSNIQPLKIMKAPVAVLAIFLATLGVSIFCFYAVRTQQSHWQLEGPQFISTNATSQQVEKAMVEAGLKLRRTDPSLPKEVINTKWSKSEKIWQGEATFVAREGELVRIVATGRRDGDAIISFERDSSDTLPVLNAFVAELEAQGVRREL